MTTTRRLSTLFAIAALLGGVTAFARADTQTSATSEAATGLATATFAGGCFWCMEPPFDRLDGVISTTSGYTGGERRHPGYGDVSSGRTAHAEAVEVVYDPQRISYGQLLEVFWRNIDPLTRNRQFCDRGSQYRTAIFFHGDKQERLARESKRQIESRGGRSHLDKKIKLIFHQGNQWRNHHSEAVEEQCRKLVAKTLAGASGENCEHRPIGHQARDCGFLPIAKVVKSKSLLKFATQIRHWFHR